VLLVVAQEEVDSHKPYCKRPRRRKNGRWSQQWVRPEWVVKDLEAFVKRCPPPSP
jgi:hypothetical protein